MRAIFITGRGASDAIIASRDEIRFGLAAVIIAI